MSQHKFDVTTTNGEIIHVCAEWGTVWEIVRHDLSRVRCNPWVHSLTDLKFRIASLYRVSYDSVNEDR